MKQTKRWLSLLLAVALVFTCLTGSLPVQAADTITSGDFRYTVTDGQATITDYTGTAEVLAIPSQIDGYPVVGIGKEAFYYNSSLTIVTIPEGVTSIGYEAFSEDNHLLTVSIPSTVMSIGASAFYECPSLISVTIPEGVTSIENSTFSECTSLSSVSLPESLTSIGISAFSNCSSLSSIRIPDNVTTIGASAFDNCSKLTEFTIPQGIVSIQGNTFKSCSSLKSISIPDSVLTIGNSAFAYCSALADVTIPDSVLTIGDSAFSGCDSIRELELPAHLVSLGASAFSGCTNLRDMVIPDGITQIKDSTFSSCYNLRSVTLQDSIISIGNRAFSGCTNLANIKIPSRVTSIGEYAFSGCHTFTDIEIPKGVTRIEEYTFSSCVNLENVVIPTGVTTIGRYAFRDDEKLRWVEIPEGVTTIENFAFNGSGLEILILPNTIISFCSFDGDYTVPPAPPLTDIYYAGSQEEWDTNIGRLGISGVTIHYNSTGPITKPEVEGFNRYIYQANYMTDPDNRVYNQMEEDRNWQSPSSIFANELTENKFLQGCIKTWKVNDAVLDLISNPLNAMKLVLEKKDMYLGLIMASLQVSTGDSWNEKLEDGISDTTGVTNNIVKIIKELRPSADIVDSASLNKIFKDLTKEEKETFKEKLKTIYKGFDGVTDILDMAFTVADSCSEYANILVCAYNLQSLSSSMNHVIAEMYNQCPANNLSLKAALSECHQILDQTYEQIFKAGYVYTAGKAGAKIVTQYFWNTAESKLLALSTNAATLMSAYVLSNMATNIVFKTNDITEANYKLIAITELEAVMDDTYGKLLADYQSNPTEQNAAAYISAVDLYYQIWDQDCRVAYSLLDTLDNSLVNQLLKLFNNGYNQYESNEEAVETHLQRYAQNHLSASTSWINTLNDDYPGQGLYEYYEKLLQEEQETYNKKVNIACPVNVSVYDTEDQLVASVIDGRIWSAGEVTVQLVGDEKTFYFSDDTEYRIEISGYDEGTMNVTATEYDDTGKETRNVCYEEISVTADSDYTMPVGGEVEDEYVITDQVKEEKVPALVDTENPEGKQYHAKISNGVMVVNGMPTIEADLYTGEKVQIYALDNVTAEFKGWTTDGAEEIIADINNSLTEFEMPASDVTITAVLETQNITCPSGSLHISADGQYISNIQPGSTVEEVTSQLSPANLVVCNADGEELDGSDRIGTGCTISLPEGGPALTVVIFGDVTGDGAVNVLDISRVQNYLLAVQDLEGAAKKAALFGKKEVDVMSLLTISGHTLNTQKIDQGYVIE